MTAQQWCRILDVLSTSLKSSWMSGWPRFRQLAQGHFSGSDGRRHAASIQCPRVKHRSSDTLQKTAQPALIFCLLFEDPEERKNLCTSCDSFWEQRVQERKKYIYIYITEHQKDRTFFIISKFLNLGNSLSLNYSCILLSMIYFLWTESSRSRLSRLTDVLIPTEKLEFSALMEI